MTEVTVTVAILTVVILTVLILTVVTVTVVTKGSRKKTAAATQQLGSSAGKTNSSSSSAEQGTDIVASKLNVSLVYLCLQVCSICATTSTSCRALASWGHWP